MKNFFLSTILLAVAYLFEPFWFLVFIFLIPILYEISKDYTKYIYLKMYLFSLVTTMVYTSFFTLTVYPLDWLQIDNSFFSLALVVFVWIILSMLMALPISFWPMILKKFSGLDSFYFGLVGAAIWTILEFARFFVIGIFSYGNQSLLGPHQTFGSLGYLTVDFFPFKSLFSTGGVLLSLFFIILINFSLYYFIKEKKMKMLLVVFILLSISSTYFFAISDETIGKIKVAFSSSRMSFAGNSFYLHEQGRIVIEKIKNIDTSAELVVLPENTNILEELLIENDMNFNYPLIGSFVIDGFEKMYNFDVFNKQVSYYDKQLLMPIGEYPIGIIGFLLDTFGYDHWLALYNNNIYNLKKGKSTDNILIFTKSSGEKIKFGGLLCIESNSQIIPRESSKNGSEFLVLLASNTPFHGSDLLSKHNLKIYKARALENGRYIVVSSNQDNSYLISDIGKVESIIDKSLVKESDIEFKIGEIERKNYTTFFTIIGNYWLLGIILILIYLYSKRIN